MSACLYCSKECTIGLDWHCLKCKTNLHWTCQNRTDVHRAYWCVQCLTTFNKTTVGYWATDTYNVHRLNRDGCIYDVNYVYKGTVVAIQPYMLTKGVFETRDAFISLNISKQEEQWAKENWNMIQQELTKIKLQ